MSKPKIREIKNISDIGDEDCVFYMQFNAEMTQIMLTVTTKVPITPEEYLEALAEFVNEVSEHPQNLFVETVDNNEDIGLH